MPEYMAEGYVRGDVASREAALRAGAAARAMAGEGASVAHLRSTFLPSDELCLHFFAAASPEDVAEALRRAAVAYERIVEARES
jgi:hypothetical protein